MVLKIKTHMEASNASTANGMTPRLSSCHPFVNILRASGQAGFILRPFARVGGKDIHHEIISLSALPWWLSALLVLSHLLHGPSTFGETLFPVPRGSHVEPTNTYFQPRTKTCILSTYIISLDACAYMHLSMFKGVLCYE